jgi:hypothetical protein
MAKVCDAPVEGCERIDKASISNPQPPRETKVWVEVKDSGESYICNVYFSRIDYPYRACRKCYKERRINQGDRVNGCTQRREYS